MKMISLHFKDLGIFMKLWFIAEGTQLSVHVLHIIMATNNVP